MKKNTLWFSLILLIGAGLSLYLMVMREHKANKTQLTNTINAFMIKPIYKDYNKYGQLHSQLTADQMKHSAHRDTSIFINPKVLFYTDDRIPWYITSDYGKSQDGTEIVFLYHHVILHQPKHTNHPETTIKTSELTFYPKSSFAKTHQAVQINQPNTIIYGTGINADLQKGIIKILSKARGVYEPNQSLQKNF